MLENLKKVIAASLYNCIEPDKNVKHPLPIIILFERLHEEKQKNCDVGKRNAAQQDHLAKKKKKCIWENQCQSNFLWIGFIRKTGGTSASAYFRGRGKWWVKGIALEKYGKWNYLIRY